MNTTAPVKKPRKKSNLPPELAPVDPSSVWRWYCVVTGSASEGKVVLRLRKYLELMGMQSAVKATLIPIGFIPVIDAKGVREIKRERLFAGYLFLLAKMTPSLRDLVLSIESVSQFICDSNDRLLHIPDRQMEQILVSMMQATNPTAAKPKFAKASAVAITGGGFQNFHGTVVDHVGDKVSVSVSIFGRKTTVVFHENMVVPAKQEDFSSTP
jgi:transcription antitermination factor NusG